MRRASRVLVWYGGPNTVSRSALPLCFRARAQQPMVSRSFSTENNDGGSGDGDKAKGPVKITKAERSAAAKNKLNDLLKSIVKESAEKPAASVADSSKKVDLKLAVPVKEKPYRKKKDPSEVTEQSKSSDPQLSKEMLNAVQSVAKTIGGDPLAIETELVQKLKTQTADKINLSELFLGMKIDRTKKPDEVPKDDMASGSRAQRVRRIMDDQSQRRGGCQQRDRGEQFENQERRRSVSDSFRRPSPAQYSRIDLFGSKPLGIFTKKSKTPPPETPVLAVWDAVHARELQLAATHPPANGFEEMILWTNQGKLWHFPINNEQGMDAENLVPFHEHVFMEPKIDYWCPKQGPIRNFMELVCVALSKNPYLTVDEKDEYLEWYHEYFKGKSAIIKEVGAGEIL